MAKYNPTNVGSGFGLTQINENFDDISDAIENTLSRDGAGPNSMGADLDMDSNQILNIGGLSLVNDIDLNNNRILNVGSGIVPTDGVNLGQVQSEALTVAQDILGSTTTSVTELTIYSVAQMKLLDLTLGAVVATAGYTSSGDGGGAKYKIVAGGTGTDDGGLYHNLANGNQAEQILGDNLNVKTFGALGNGITSDNTAFTAAQATSIPLFLPSGTFICSLSSKVDYSGPGVVESTPGTINLAYNRLGNIGGNANKNHFSVGGIPRCSGGVFTLLEDAGHNSLNTSGITQNGDYQIRIQYAKTATKVNNAVVAIDNELAPYGIFCGGDVGIGFTNFTPQAPLEGFVTKIGAGGTWFGTVLFKDADLTVDYTNDVLSIEHPVGWPAGCVPMVQNVFKFSNPRDNPRIAVGFSQTKVEIRSVVDLAGLVQWNGSAFGFLPGVNTFISDDELSNITFSESGGVLTVTHPQAVDYDIQVSPFGQGSYIPFVDNVGPNSFDVVFYDFSGTKITTPSSAMRVFIRRKHALKGKIQDHQQFLIKAPLTAPKSANFSDIAGNNFWFMGDMENE